MRVQSIGSHETEIYLRVGGRDAVVLVSYSTPVAAIVKRVPLQTDVYWSVTTSKHITRFFERHEAGTREEAKKMPQSFFNTFADGIDSGITDDIVNSSVTCGSCGCRFSTGEEGLTAEENPNGSTPLCYECFNSAKCEECGGL